MCMFYQEIKKRNQAKFIFYLQLVHRVLTVPPVILWSSSNSDVEHVQPTNHVLRQPNYSYGAGRLRQGMEG